MGMVAVVKKPEQKPVVAGSISPLKTYRIVEIRKSDRDKEEWASVGDIIVSIPGEFYSGAILNTRTGKILHTGTGFSDRVFCVRDFSIQSVTLAFDENEMPA